MAEAAVSNLIQRTRSLGFGLKATMIYGGDPDARAEERQIDASKPPAKSRGVDRTGE